MANRNCRNPDGWDYGLYAAAEAGDRIMTSLLEDHISAMQPSNDRTIAGIAALLSQVLFRASKVIINDPLCHKINLDKDNVPSINTRQSRMLSYQNY